MEVAFRFGEELIKGIVKVRGGRRGEAIFVNSLGNFDGFDFGAVEAGCGWRKRRNINIIINFLFCFGINVKELLRVFNVSPHMSIAVECSTSSM